MLNILYQQEGISQREICNSLCIKPSTVTVSLQQMEKAASDDRKSDSCR
ncbi:MAG: MarR family transcriptional regulator [Lachnospiraceae bacterium]|nr:MarR family transcriptional regulator [Lachnospiraceae bacterium]